MPTILLVSTTKLEIKPLLENATFKSPHLASLNHQKLDIEILITGVGGPAMGYHLTRQLQIKSYNFIILVGISGSYSAKLKLGEVVVVQSERFADLGLQKGNQFSSLFDMKLQDENEFPFTAGRMENYTLINNAVFNAMPQVSGNTVNCLRSPLHPAIQSGAEVESMEGATFFMSCMLEKQAFVQLRSISNYVGDTDKKLWDIPLAVKNLNVSLLKALDEIQ
jgi:futalosine hydrolase